MTHRERILAACRGEKPDRIPWVPRMDLWYNAHARSGDLPEQFARCSLREIARELGVGYHTVVPNFLDVRSREDTADRCLGIYRLKNMAFETVLSGVDRVLAPENGMTRVTYHAPAGSLTGVFGYSEDMKEAGASIPWVTEQLIKKPGDYEILANIFANLQVRPTYDKYSAWQQWVGDDGVAVAFGNLSASPMHHIMHQVMDMNDFYMALYDRPDELKLLAASMEPWFKAMFDVLAGSPAEIVFMGGNYDATITYPPFFEEHILPWVASFADQLHAEGKLLLNHTDGENTGLVPLYSRCHFDIADSFCPRPMTRMTLPEFADRLPGLTIWGGIPSVSLCRDSMPEKDFDRMLDDTLSFAEGRTHLILGIADTTPPDADFNRILKITRRVSA
ncbi:MAG: hypothetical protein JW909_10400 [Planctomycetes bacterium]|nr:hypothetical protein [Planctomycetota bacterium]